MKLFKWLFKIMRIIKIFVLKIFIMSLHYVNIALVAGRKLFHGSPATTCATIEKRKDKKNSDYLILPEGHKIPIMDIITVEPTLTGSFINVLLGSEFKSNCNTKVDYNSLSKLLCGYEIEITYTP